jgi:Polyketide cyclase / dehydrase and lipid transport
VANVQGRLAVANVYVSAIIDAPAARVWAVVRDFNGLPAWTPFVAESRIEQNDRPDRVGAIRNFHLQDGGRIRERLLALSDYDLSMTYSILESPMGVENYTSTLKLMPVTDGDRTFAEWSAEFDCPPEREAELVAHIGRNVFQAAFRSLQGRFGPIA